MDSPAVINERAVMVARRNALMRELLRIAPVTRRPPSESSYKTPANHKPAVLHKNRPVKKQVPVKKAVIKEKPKAQPQQKAVEENQTVDDAFADNMSTYAVDGVQISLYDYFGINSETADDEVIDKLRYINDWTFKPGRKYRDAMISLNDLDVKLGAGDEGRAKVFKIYNWLRVRYGKA